MNQGQNSKKMKIYQQDISRATGLDVKTIRNAIKGGELNMDSLVSIAFFVVKKTICPPEEILMRELNKLGEISRDKNKPK